jgi:GNAT superfamily N-acetyltransferase
LSNDPHGAFDSPPQRTDGPVTTTVTRRVKPGHEPVYEQCRHARAVPGAGRRPASVPDVHALRRANVESVQPSEPHRYLEVLSVRPEHQRHGISSRLVTPILARADRDQVPCHLETADPANVEFYRPFGFEVVNPALEVIPGGPAPITMCRPTP